MTDNPYAVDPRHVPPPRHPQRTTILVLGIVGIACCGLAGILAFFRGRRALRDIDDGLYSAEDRGTIKAGYICGIVSLCMSGVAILFYLALFVVGIISS